jgi:hypothetical protein
MSLSQHTHVITDVIKRMKIVWHGGGDLVTVMYCISGLSACPGQPNLTVGQADIHANLPDGQPNMFTFLLIFNKLDK